MKLFIALKERCVITRLSGRFKLLSLLQQSEGNTLAATEFIRLPEARDLLQQNNEIEYAVTWLQQQSLIQ